MNVVENDNAIRGMLIDELKRCQEMVGDLEKAASALPRGVLNLRKKRYKEKEYLYYYLKYREGRKVISKHIPKDEVDRIKNGLELRKRYEREIKSFIKRIGYLNKLLGSSEE